MLCWLLGCTILYLLSHDGVWSFSCWGASGAIQNICGLCDLDISVGPVLRTWVLYPEEILYLGFSPPSLVPMSRSHFLSVLETMSMR
ncbi:hypothetical protein GDO81_021777 [Engystomops pustulosus]|uniref:Secreted protein n=1 Tax=Engystomops pustulosus TaxID=76066 RepID=A0AAV6ZG30_ENGPU|nr:hypothetical protein GDO81_021777 [Engystomops pustulosus]